MIIGIVCGVIVLIGITIIVVYKKQQARAPKDVWVSKSRQPTRGKSQKQALVPDAEPAEFMNPTWVLQIVWSGLQTFTYYSLKALLVVVVLPLYK